MIHSFLIVNGTRKKRADVAATHTPARPTGGSPSKFDTTILKPEEDKQIISIDQVRDLQHQLSLKPYAAKFKIGIILEAQRMTTEAQNALLKTLEEPPAHSVLVLTAPSTKSLLPTTVSRCQIVRLPLEIDLDLESEEHQKSAEEFLELLGLGRGERLAWVEINNSKIKIQNSNIHLLDVWTSVLRDLLLTQQGCQNLILNSVNKFTTILQSMNDSTEPLTNALGQTIKTKGLIASTNVSPRLALEVLLLDLPLL